MTVSFRHAAAAVMLTLMTSGLPAQAKDMTKLTVGMSLSTASVPVYLARQEGIFEKHGLEVEIAVIQSGAEAVPQLLNGSFDVSMGDAVGTINAVGNRVPIKVVGITSIAPDSPDKDYSAVVTTAGTVGGIGELSGHTVAVNQAGGMAELTAKAAVDASGGDSAKVQFVELPFPQMIQAVAQKRVDAAVLVEPFVSMAPSAGLEIVGRPQAVGTSGIPSIVFIAATKGTVEKADAIAAFIDAVSEANKMAEEDAALARKVAASYSPMSVEQLAATRMPTFPLRAGELDSLQALVDLMMKYGVISSAPDMDALLWTGASE